MQYLLYYPMNLDNKVGTIPLRHFLRKLVLIPNTVIRGNTGLPCIVTTESTYIQVIIQQFLMFNASQFKTLQIK